MDNLVILWPVQERAVVDSLGNLWPKTYKECSRGWTYSVTCDHKTGKEYSHGCYLLGMWISHVQGEYREINLKLSFFVLYIYVRKFRFIKLWPKLVMSRDWVGKRVPPLVSENLVKFFVIVFLEFIMLSV